MPGCVNAVALNYLHFATVGDGSCEYAPGCMDHIALNFRRAATVGDGSCLYDHHGDDAALLAAFQVDPAGRAAWDQLHGWDAATGLCAWEGVSCIGSGHRVTGVDLPAGRADLRFTLGAALGNLAALQGLTLSGTGLSGTLPDSVGNLTALQSLNLYWSGLSGTLPDSVGNLTALRYLRLDRTGLSGTLPDAVGSMTALQTLPVYETGLSGTLPPNLCDRPAPWILHPRSQADQLSHSLDLHSMRLSGAIPDLTNCIALQSLTLTKNSFGSAGSAPAEPHARLPGRQPA